LVENSTTSNEEKNLKKGRSDIKDLRSSSIMIKRFPCGFTSQMCCISYKVYRMYGNLKPISPEKKKIKSSLVVTGGLLAFDPLFLSQNGV
jgi:hypothetical protein